MMQQQRRYGVGMHTVHGGVARHQCLHVHLLLVGLTSCDQVCWPLRVGQAWRVITLCWWWSGFKLLVQAGAAGMVMRQQ